MMSEINGRLVVREVVGRASSREQKYVLSDSASIFSGLTLKQKREVADKFNRHDKLVEENQRLTAIATKHATRADELYEALENQMAILEGYKRLMIHPLSLQDDIDDLRSVLDKSQIDAVSNSNDD